MHRMFAAAAALLAAAAVAPAHFVFVVPEADGGKAKVIFSDTFEPDTKVNVEKIADTKLAVRDAAGKETPLTTTKGEGFYGVDVPGSGPRVVFGVTEYGVLQKGDAKPFRLTYYPKALVGSVPTAAATLGEKAGLEVVPATEGGKTRFRVLAAGKPVADSEVTVIVPGGAKKPAKTDADGYTPAFEGSGRFGVYAKRIEAKAGELAGKKYDEVRHYATLVADLGR